MKLLPDRVKSWGWRSYGSSGDLSTPIYGIGTDRGISVTSDLFRQAIATAELASVVAAVVGWKAIMLPRAQWQLQKMGKEDWEPDDQRHPVLTRLNVPTPWHSGSDLLMATLTDWCIRGEAYWIPVSARGVSELWWRPATSMEPKVDQAGHLDHYEYRSPSGKITRYQPDEVIAIRFGQHPDNPWRGVSPLTSLGAEIWTDQEAARASAVAMRNLGVVGMVISPGTSDSMGVVSQDDLIATRDYVRKEYTGEQRGETLVLGFPAKVDYPRREGGADASHKPIHDWAEERVCAVLRVPAAVVGFGPGLEQTKVGATMAVLEKQAWRTGLLPDAEMIASAVSRQLLPMFGLDPEDYRLRFDTSMIAELQGDMVVDAQAWQVLVSSGIATRGEAREAFGLEVMEAADDVFLLPLSVVEVGRSSFLDEEEEPDPVSLPVLPELMPPDDEEEEEDE